MKISVAAGDIVGLSPESAIFTEAFENKLCLFGAMIKTTEADAVYSSYFTNAGGCSGGVVSSSFHPGDGSWHFIGSPGIVDQGATCLPDPRFYFDNTSGASTMEVYITTPSFVFERGVKPHLDAAPISSAGGIMTGTLSTGLMTVASPPDNSLELLSEGNVVKITGSNTIQSINLSADIFPQGTTLIFLFENANVIVEHNAARITLLNNTNYTSEAK